MNNKKGSLELSVNAIVILIIALAILGLVIGFAVSKFRDLADDFEDDGQKTPEATSQDPITLPGGANKITLEKGKDKSFEISVYNSGNTAIDPKANLALTCSPSDVGSDIFETPTTNIDAGQIKSVPILAKVASDDSVGQYSCELNIDGITRTLFIEVR